MLNRKIGDFIVEEFEMLRPSSIKMWLKVRIKKDPTALNAICVLLKRDPCMGDSIAFLLESQSKLDFDFWRKAYAILKESWFRKLPERERTWRFDFGGDIGSIYKNVLDLDDRVTQIFLSHDIEPGMLFCLSHDELRKFLATIPGLKRKVTQNKIIEKIDRYKNK